MAEHLHLSTDIVSMLTCRFLAYIAQHIVLPLRAALRLN